MGNGRPVNRVEQALAEQAALQVTGGGVGPGAGDPLASDTAEIAILEALDTVMTDEQLAMMIEQMPGAALPEEFDQEEFLGNTTASKFLCLAQDRGYYEGFAAGLLGTMTLINLCAPGLHSHPRFALIYRIYGRVLMHLKRLRDEQKGQHGPGPEKARPDQPGAGAGADVGGDADPAGGREGASPCGFGASGADAPGC